MDNQPTLTMIAPGRCDMETEYDPIERRINRIEITCKIPAGVNYIGLNISAKTREELLEGASLDKLVELVRTALLSGRDVFLTLRGDAVPANQLSEGAQQLTEGKP